MAADIFTSTLPFAPSALTLEIMMAVLAISVLVLGIILPKGSRHGLGWVSLLGIVCTMFVAVSLWGEQKALVDGMYLLDNYALFWKILFLTAAALVILGCMRFVDNMGSQAEYYSLTLFATLGMMVMASAGDFITFYLGLELMTFSFIILVCFRKKDPKSIEAGIKYLLLAGVSSAVLLYGLSFIYGLTGSIVILEIASIIAQQPFSAALMLAVVMVIAGLGFKISAVPFHMWSPDVYEGAPTPVTAFLAVGSKAASFAILLRIFVGGLPGIWENWALVMAILAAVTIIVGNLVAIPQTNVKRMLAYSSIAQAGYILVGLITASEAGIKGVLFYSFIYVFATMAAFIVVAYYYHYSGSDELKDYAGLAQRSPLMAGVMLVALLSMAGIPPLAGFAGKFYLFSTAVNDFLWLVFIGLIMSMASVYYYLRVALVMYRDDPLDATPIKVSSPVAVTLVLATVATLVIGVWPGPLSEIVNGAAHTFFLH